MPNGKLKFAVIRKRVTILSIIMLLCRCVTDSIVVMLLCRCVTDSIVVMLLCVGVLQSVCDGYSE